MAELSLEQRRALALARARQAQAQAAPQGAEAMRARGLSSDPAGMAEMNAQAEAAMRSPGEKAEAVMQQVGQGGFDSLMSLYGAPSDLASWATGVDLPGGADFMRGIFTGSNYQEVDPKTETERRARTAGEYVAPGMFGGALGTLSGGASGLAAGEVREQGGGPVAEVTAALLAGAAPIAVANKVSKVAQTKRAIAAVPDVDDLKAQAGGLYDKGRATGATAPGSLTQGLEAKLSQIATDAGIIAPDGTMAPKYADLGHVMKMARSYAGGDMNPEQMQQVRRALQAAAQSADANEARIGTQMLRTFDESIRNPLVPEFQQGDRLYSRAMRGEEVGEAIDIARKGRRSAADTAISNEFQNLVRRGIRGDLTYPPELEAAVERAANGSAGRQFASTVGKGAPTSVVGGGLGFGVPASVATGILGPVGGAAAGTAASGTGLIAKLLANRMAMGDARVAMATALNGAPLPAPQTPEAVRAALISQLLATSAAQQPR